MAASRARTFSPTADSMLYELSTYIVISLPDVICSRAGRNGWANAITRKKIKSSLDARTRYCLSFLFCVVSWRTCSRKRVLEKKILVVFRKLNRWIMMGMASAVSAQRNDGYEKLIAAMYDFDGRKLGKVGRVAE